MTRVLLALALLGSSCGAPSPEPVVVYCSVDDLYARDIFAAFTRETAVSVRPLFDTEEAKTLGLAHRLLSERSSPQADVFWNGECSRTALLAREGALESFRPASAAGVPDPWRDPAGFWTGFGARARVIVYNTKRVPDPPRSIAALADPRWRGRVAMANPAFGTTAAHVAALAHTLGEEALLKLLAALKANGLRLVGGNSHVRDLVARGDCDLGLTDTDDVWIGKDRGDAIDMVYPDQERAGTLVIPNSAALVKGAPHPAQARRFLEWLLRPETEALLAKGRSRQIPVRPEVSPELGKIRVLRMDWGRLDASEALFEKVRRTLGL